MGLAKVLGNTVDVDKISNPLLKQIINSMGSTPEGEFIFFGKGPHHKDFKNHRDKFYDDSGAYNYKEASGVSKHTDYKEGHTDHADHTDCPHSEYSEHEESSHHTESPRSYSHKDHNDCR